MVSGINGLINKPTKAKLQSPTSQLELKKPPR